MPFAVNNHYTLCSGNIYQNFINYYLQFYDTTRG